MHDITILSVTPVADFTEPAYAIIDGILNTEIAQWHQFLKESLPNGFQAMVKVKTNEHGTEYSKGIKTGKSGNFAKVKMETLERFTFLALTGSHDINTLVHMIHASDPNYDTTGFSNLENLCQLTKKQHEELRSLGLTAYLGGIRVPFTRYSSIPGCGVNTEPGEILISFSALTGEQDLMMCFVILAELQKAFQKATPNRVYILDLSELEKSPIARFNMRMRMIESVVA